MALLNVLKSFEALDLSYCFSISRLHDGSFRNVFDALRVGLDGENENPELR